MSVGRFHGGYGNQEGMTVPSTDATGQLLKARESMLIAQPAPIGTQDRLGTPGTVGGLATLAAGVNTLYADQGYWGDLPDTQQGTVDAPDPWMRT